MRMAAIPPLEVFDSSKVNWKLVRSSIRPVVKISSYAEGKNAPDKTSAALCTFIGSDAFKLLCSLCSPKKPEECTYKTDIRNQYKGLNHH